MINDVQRRVFENKKCLETIVSQLNTSLDMRLKMLFVCKHLAQDNIRLKTHIEFEIILITF